MHRKFKIAGPVIALLLLGFFRESLFVHLNYILYYKYHQPAQLASVSLGGYAFLTTFSYSFLYAGKWVLTLVFVAVFWWVQRALLRALFQEKKSVLWLGMLYLSLLLLAGISFGSGWLFGNMEQGYRFSRIFMGLLQSPAPAMVLIPLTWFLKANSATKEQI